MEIKGGIKNTINNLVITSNNNMQVYVLQFNPQYVEKCDKHWSVQVVIIST